MHKIKCANLFILIFSLFENAAKNKQLFNPRIKDHISKTDIAVKSEIEFDIPMITDLVYTFQMICKGET
jgi:hypothetical protein